MSPPRRLMLLAPVPWVHLRDAIGICHEQGRVIFGTDAFETFLKLDTDRAGQSVDTLIYASHTGSDHFPDYPSHLFEAVYVGSRAKVRGYPPSELRPPETHDERWGYFWEVSGLKPSTWTMGKLAEKLRHQPGFRTHGPIRIEPGALQPV